MISKAISVSRRCKDFLYFIIGSVVLFFFVFGFRLPILKNSVYVAFSIAFLSLLFSWKKRNLAKVLFKNHFFWLAIFSQLLFVFFSCVSLLVNNSDDVSIFKTLFNDVFSVVASVIVVSSLYYQRKVGVFHLFCAILVIQSVAIIAMMLFPSFNSVIQSIVRSDAEAEFMSATYGGVRGFGIAGSVAFGLSITMGFLGFLVLVWFSSPSCHVNSGLKFFIILLSLFASISAGRAAMLGYVLGFFYFIFSSTWFQKIKGSFKYSIYGWLSFICLYILISESGFENIVSNYSHYAFQFIYNYMNSGNLSTTSTSHLETMYFPLNSHQVLVGDGQYTNYDGTYYLSTDAGFMRFALFMGIPFSFVIYSFFCILCLVSIRYFQDALRKGMVIFLIAMMTFLYHIKGEVVLFSVSYMKVFYFLIFFFIARSKMISKSGE
ncbi:hypothetical protein [Gallaecimonas pentaromativorans]|uniref:hypothetical protein n=1 Tax=Gallaecimonas pentaromativorans TaxID=584787 RepID=UPI0012EEB909|nr:hypothetical protein [Gallaecimonas pentaromativorans]